MQSGFKNIQQPSSKDCIMRIVHVNDVEGYVFYS
jgi:hypothetical protein